MKTNQFTVELNQNELEDINGGVIPVVVWAIAKGVCLIGGSALAGAATGYSLYKLFD